MEFKEASPMCEILIYKVLYCKCVFAYQDIAKAKMSTLILLMFIFFHF